MKAKFSEFTYGFAVVNELVKLKHFQLAPIFPSLLEEGKSGGGYDVKLEENGVPILLQFKLSENMTRRNARERDKIRNEQRKLHNRATFDIPYFRFGLMDPAKSNQHQMLIEHETSSSVVRYIAPNFIDQEDLNTAWRNDKILENAKLFKPSTIGPIEIGKHSVCWNRTESWKCSSPNKIDHSTIQDFVNEINDKSKNGNTLSRNLFVLKERTADVMNDFQSGEFMLKVDEDYTDRDSDDEKSISEDKLYYAERPRITSVEKQFLGSRAENLSQFTEDSLFEGAKVKDKEKFNQMVTELSRDITYLLGAQLFLSTQ